MESIILYFILLLLSILVNLSLDNSHKQDKFFKTLLEKRFKFVSSNRSSTIVLNLDFLLRLVEIDLLPEKQGYKRDVLKTSDIGYIKIVFAL